jgi:DNA-directed RNA polymerase subunit RPC12/RpoP
MVLSLPNKDKVFVDSFRKTDRSNFIKLFQILKDKTEFMDLDFMIAMKYMKPEVRKEKEHIQNDKEEQKNKKMELLRKGFRLIEEIKCECTQCNTVWFYGKQDKMDDISNKLISVGAHMQGKSLTGSYHEQLIKDTNKCPKCGSRAIAKTKVKYWFNNKSGESVEYFK